jgi:hypothetical protein
MPTSSVCLEQENPRTRCVPGKCPACKEQERVGAKKALATAASAALKTPVASDAAKMTTEATA